MMRTVVNARCGLVASLLLAALPAPAQSVNSRAAAFAEDSSRVIVRYKADAPLLRAHALAAGDAQAQSRTLRDRAAALGARRGLALEAAGAVSERVQVLRAQGVSARELAARLALDPDVASAEPDRRARRAAVPNDPLFASGGANGPAVGQWYLRAPAGEVASAIDAVSAWDTTQGSAAVIVAVLDTGVRYDHPDLAGKLLPGYDMVSDAAISNDGDGRDADATDPGDWVTSAEAGRGAFAGCDASASSWHGTQVSGIVGAATGNGVGMAGAGWNLRVLPVRVLGKCFGYTSDIAAAIRWAAGVAVPGVPTNPSPAKVINLSLGSGGACSLEERDAIAAANAAGAVVVAAAGNTAGLAASSPANCPGAIGVAGLRHAGSKVGFSDVGPEISIAAPGGNCVNIGPGEPCLYPILTTINTGLQGPVASSYTDSFDASVGTSFASPLVAATAGLMLSANSALTPAGLRAAMRASARGFVQSGLPDDPFTGPLQLCRAPDGIEQLQCYCSTSTCGAGMLDAGAAVRAVTGLNVVVAVASPATPAAGETVTLTSEGSTVAAGRTIAAREWAIADGGGIVGGFSGATNGLTATLVPSAAGSFTVRVTITDSAGVAASATRSVSVAAAPVPPTVPPTTGGGGGGGGSMTWPWLAALLIASAALARRRLSAWAKCRPTKRLSPG